MLERDKGRVAFNFHLPCHLHYALLVFIYYAILIMLKMCLS